MRVVYILKGACILGAVIISLASTEMDFLGGFSRAFRVFQSVFPYFWVFFRVFFPPHGFRGFSYGKKSDPKNLKKTRKLENLRRDKGVNVSKLSSLEIKRIQVKKISNSYNSK